MIFMSVLKFCTNFGYKWREKMDFIHGSVCTSVKIRSMYAGGQEGSNQTISDDYKSQDK